jgi:UDP-N-acetylmuramoylalanine-D-glutamate ligase
LDAMFKNKKIFIYGAGNDGRGIFHALKRNGFHTEAFIDRSTILTRGGGGIRQYANSCS